VKQFWCVSEENGVATQELKQNTGAMTLLYMLFFFVLFINTREILVLCHQSS